MVPIFMLAALALEVWAWRRCRARVVSGAVSRPAALLRYGAWALTPFTAVAVLFFSAVGLEELTGAAVIPEPIGRATLPVAALMLGLAVVCWCAFLMMCTMVWRTPGAGADRR